MFSGIEHTALSLHIGYTIESFLIHIEILPSARDDKFSPVRISGSSSIHVFFGTEWMTRTCPHSHEIFTMSRNYAME